MEMDRNRLEVEQISSCASNQGVLDCCCNSVALPGVVPGGNRERCIRGALIDTGNQSEDQRAGIW